MNRSKLLLALGGALILYALYAYHLTSQQPSPSTQPAPKVQPKPANPKPQPHRPCPNCPSTVREQAPSPHNKAPQLGGLVSPDGTCQTIYIPDDIVFRRNIASKGAGCCGFRALEYCAQLQGVPELVDWPEQLRQDGVPGGAYPQKVEQLLQRYAPNESHWQDTTKSHALLAACIASQRPCAVDYNGHDPHYHGSIAHCVTLIAFDEEKDWAAILDNNYPQLDQIVWMSIAEFDHRWGGWAYGLLAQRPGYCAGHSSDEEWEFFPNKEGLTNYGLVRRKMGAKEYTILNGERSSTQAIIEALGPAMVPAQPIPISVDHKIDLSDAKQLALLVGGVLLVIYIMDSERGK